MGFDRRKTKVEQRSDLFVRAPFREQVQYFSFAVGQQVIGIAQPSLLERTDIVFDEDRCHGWAEERLAGRVRALDEVDGVVHVLAAVVWVGGGVTTQVLAFRIIRADDPARLAGFGKDIEKVGMFVFTPAALVVLLSALSLRRVGFGLLLIVAFSLGLALVLVSIGLFVVYAGRLVTRLDERGPLVTRWLPLMSSAVMTLLGLSIAIQTLASGGLAWKLT